MTKQSTAASVAQAHVAAAAAVAAAEVVVAVVVVAAAAGIFVAVAFDSADV